MTFVERFVHLRVALSDTDRGVNELIRFKVPKHPLESADFFWSRILVFILNYSPSLTFTPDTFNETIPIVGLPSLTGGFEVWCEVGAPSREKLRRALRDRECKKIGVYFTSRSDIEQFSKHLRGSTENWIERISFFLIDSSLLTPLIHDSATRHEWSITLIDGKAYVDYGAGIHEGEIAQISMWEEYQKHLMESHR